MSDAKTDWLVKAKMPGKEPLWYGTYQARGREEAKRAAARFLSKYLPLEAMIICIAQGRIAIEFDGPEIIMENIDLPQHRNLSTESLLERIAGLESLLGRVVEHIPNDAIISFAPDDPGYAVYLSKKAIGHKPVP